MNNPSASLSATIANMTERQRVLENRKRQTRKHKQHYTERVNSNLAIIHTAMVLAGDGISSV